MGINTNLARTMVVSVFTISLAGCYLRPNFGPPGTILQQRARAVLSDPFPNNDLGPPVVGGRPRGYDLPLPEPTNIQASPYSELNKNQPGPLRRLFNPQPQSVPPPTSAAPNGYPVPNPYPVPNYSPTVYPPAINQPTIYPPAVSQPGAYPPPIYPQTGYPQQ